jgi:hypothetical protein
MFSYMNIAWFRVGSGGRDIIGHYFKLVAQSMSLKSFGNKMAIWAF